MATGSEKSIALLLEAFRDLITEQNGWAADKSTGEWTGQGFRSELEKRTGLSLRTLARLLSALESLGVIKLLGIVKLRRSPWEVQRKSYRWVLLKPDARVVFENGMHKLAEEE